MNMKVILVKENRDINQEGIGDSVEVVCEDDIEEKEEV